MGMRHSLISLIFIVYSVYCHSLTANSIKCNFKDFNRGCIDEEGSECDTRINKCVCKPSYAIRLREFCLQTKFIGDKCWASAQCNHIANAGCYNYREEYNHIPSAFFGHIQKNWPSGTCRCKIGYHFESETKECVKKTIGSWCYNVWDCRTDTRSANTVCEDNACKCSPSYLYNRTTHECDYRETYGNSCTKDEQCFHPSVCSNGTCQCDAAFHHEKEKTPQCQPNNNVNEHKAREETFQATDGDKSFEIFIITVIPLIILFFVLKPCLKKFSKCKTPPDEIICGSREIKIKNSPFKENLCANHIQQNRLQTIEEINEEKESKGKDEIVVSFEGSRTDEKSMEEESQVSQREELEVNKSPNTNPCAKSSIDKESASDSDDAPQPEPE